MNFKQFLRTPSNTVGLVIVLLFSGGAVLSHFWTPHDPLELRATSRLQPPSASRLLGTDFNGRDILSRILAGSAISMRAGASIVLLSLSIGATLGVAAAVRRGLVDEVIMRAADVMLSMPPLLLGMIMVTIMGHSLGNAILAVGLIRWPDYARLVRAVVMSELGKPYVEAARAVGASGTRIFLVHIARNVMSPISVKLSLDMGTAVLLLASLSFIGLGASPPTPEWGAMTSQGRAYIMTAPWVALFPGLAIFLLVLGFSLLGDGLRDHLDPRMRGIR